MLKLNKRLLGVWCRQCMSTLTVSSPNLSVKADRRYGQPTADSHPHLINPGEVTCGTTLAEYQGRRLRFLQNLLTFSQSQYKTSDVVAVVSSATKVHMTENIPYPFRQNSDFLYLTGFLEPDSLLLLKSTGENASDYKSILFVPKRDVYAELWDGPRTGADAAAHMFGVDEAYSTDDFQNTLSSLCKMKNSTFGVWCDFPTISQIPQFEKVVKSCVTLHAPSFVDSPRNLLHQLRMIKSPSEIKLMARSCEIASDAFKKTIAATKANVNEHDLYAKMDYECRVRGADRLAYPPVIAGGDRATIIHYVANNRTLNDKELLLIDAGCEYQGYVSDITRTWPVSNRFEPWQKELYEALLDTQQRLINKCKEGVSLDHLHNKMTELLASNFQQIGLIPKSLSALEKAKLVSKYCPHHVSHYLGMDVHDTCTISRSVPLRPGMVITIEPGVYINTNDNQAPPVFRGVGMRIEDNVLITDKDPIVLSSTCPKTISHIEALR